MNKKKIDELIGASYRYLDQKKVEKIASLLSIKDLKKYINGLKLGEKENTLIISSSSPLNNQDLKKIIKLFPYKKVILEDGNAGTVLNLDEESVSIILLGETSSVKEGDTLKTTGKMLSIEVSEELLGRVIDPLGNPQDNKPKIKKGKNMPLEKIAAGVVDREPVSTPLKTGIKAIDSMIPIGRGQRELIIGDRQTGKTAIAIDSIINQKFNKKPVVCVYVAIGQKKSTIAQVIDRLNSEGAGSYTIVVSASASD